ncbi:uncharacterized protein YdaU (DUF1376 family) [Sphingomonas naasensis]|uniref:DUF1376 domain-containing protein n=1 Tax=Sphingomonas naasensis TaxID=1344951 RepID=A0A4S1WQW5_9SPHN|nr:DUF1376 domain-containing protein [Sphingomonas naasensis]NIJ18462.1 uncharacterized protein YdaU (DUF1376 family) [Sphingomonas naasensis]TGX45724.1 DUF1376 domain-containing protein [Sphingomonas naasensis]
MGAQHYHKRYHSDALAGFMSLTLEERGAYQTILDLIYDRGGPVQDNERLLAGYMGCSVRKWRTLRDDLIAKGKIRLTEAGEITNSRAEKEIENQLKTSRKHAENGSSGGRTRADNTKNANENNESEQAGLKPGSSHTRYQIPDKREVARARPSDPPSELEQRCRQIAEIISLTRPIGPADRDQMRTWIADGLHFDWHIVEGAKQIAAREQARGRTVSGFRYLDGGVRDYAAEWQRENQRLRAVGSEH